METSKKREDYIDMMKALGMLFIVWGHCFPPLSNDFIYAFNVPLFFIVSGYLTRSDDALPVVWRKCWGNLLVPYFILSFLHCAGFIFKHTDDGLWAYSIVAIFGGFHSLHGAAGCSNMWFVYSLVIMRILFALAGRTNRGMVILLVVSIVGAVAYRMSGLEWAWAVTDAVIALPFFLFGHLLKDHWHRYYEHFVRFVKQLHTGLRVALCLSLFLLTWWIASVNGGVGLFIGDYGHSLSLCLLGGIVGTSAVMILSLSLGFSKILRGGVK